MRTLGIDTSNYTTSAALYDEHSGAIVQRKRPLPVEAGQIGLRQSDAVFLHVRQLGAVLEELLAGVEGGIDAVGVSTTPTDEEGSYMPCFLAGQMAAQAVSAALDVPLHRVSHQAGHVMAALAGVERTDLARRSFLAFHVSGGTTQALHVQPGGERVFDIRPVAATLDLNAGQVIDRVGALLGLGFPAGPELERLAARSRQHYTPKPTLKGLDCCLSGLENQCTRRREQGEAPEDVANYCQSAIAATLLAMTRRLCEAFPRLPLVYAGGVMSNGYLQSTIGAEFEALFAPPVFSADNAAGVAVLAATAHQTGKGGAPC